MKAKAVLCKLPIIDMAQNRFHDGKGAEARGENLSVRDYRRMIRNQNSYSPNLGSSKSKQALMSSDSRSLLKNNSKRHIAAAQQSYDQAINSSRDYMT